MSTQQDSAVRVVALVNLEAMIAASGGQYWLEKVSRSRVSVGTYRQSDEYGGREAVIAVFPCYPSDYMTDKGIVNPRVVLSAMRYVGDVDDQGYGLFHALCEVTAVRAGLEGADWSVFRFDSGASVLAHMDEIKRAYNVSNPLTSD